ncbi:MAG: hypothetical protein ACR2NT_08320 [Acidimicrobiia bacterium]
MDDYSEKLQTVLDDVSGLIARAAEVQCVETDEAAFELLDELKWDYARWFERAKLYLPDDLHGDFELQFLDTATKEWRIARFFEEARSLSTIDLDYVAPDQRQRYPKWSAEAQRTFIEPIERQKWLLIRAQARHEHGGQANEVLDSYVHIFRRLPRAVQILKTPSRAGRAHLEFQDEYDLQKLVHAVLAVLANDVENEESSRKVLSSSPRIDFVVRDQRIAVEAKWVHEAGKRKKLGSEIADDTLRYRRHPDVDGILFVIYDPEGHLTNPSGFEKEMCNTGREFPTRLVVVR